MSKKWHRREPAKVLFDELVDLSSIMPWWSTLPIAILLFLFVPLNFTPIGVTGPSDIIVFVTTIFFQVLLKYIVPLAFVLGAVLNILSKFKSVTLFSNISRRGAAEVINKLSWQDFEFLLAEHFKKEGYDTVITGGGGADGGIDIKLFKDGETYLVQCKHYKSWKVSVHIVREFFGIVTAEKAIGGYIITSGRFTNDAYSFAKSKNIHLINGNDLIEMLNPEDMNNAKSMTTACPRCGGELVEKTGKFGRFLGCDNYPRCKYTANLN